MKYLYMLYIEFCVWMSQRYVKRGKRWTNRATKVHHKLCEHIIKGRRK